MVAIYDTRPRPADPRFHCPYCGRFIWLRTVTGTSIVLATCMVCRVYFTQAQWRRYYPAPEVGEPHVQKRT